LDGVPAFLRAARNADGAGAALADDLPGNPADGSRRRGDEHGLARLHAGKLEADPGRQPRGSQNSEPAGDGGLGGIELCEVARIEHVESGPAVDAEDTIAGHEERARRGEDLRDNAAIDDALFPSGPVAAEFAHAQREIGIERYETR